MATARRAGATGTLTVRADSAYYNHDVVAATRRARAQFSLTARMDPAVTAAISRIPEEAWVSIKYPNAIWDEQEGRWVSDAQVAQTTYTAFTSRNKAEHVTARLIVRRVKRLNPKATKTGQDELFATYRHHAVFTDSPLSMLAAEASHRDHAIVEQVIADLKAGPLAHAPSGSFCANGAWTVLAAIAFNLTRAAGVLASVSATVTSSLGPVLAPASPVAQPVSARRARADNPPAHSRNAIGTTLQTSPPLVGLIDRRQQTALSQEGDVAFFSGKKVPCQIWVTTRVASSTSTVAP